MSSIKAFHNFYLKQTSTAHKKIFISKKNKKLELVTFFGGGLILNSNKNASLCSSYFLPQYAAKTYLS